MKLLFSSFTLFLLFTACKKEIPPITKEPDVQERFISAISEYIIYTRLDNYCAFENSTDPDHYHYERNYRMVEGYAKDNQYYYKVQCKTTEYFKSPGDTGPYEYLYISDWEEINFLYRYDWANKKSFVYRNEDFEHPTEVMDFNLEVGESYDVAHHIDSLSRSILIDSIGYNTIDGLEFPILFMNVGTGNKYYGYSFLFPNALAFEEDSAHKVLKTNANVPPCGNNYPAHESYKYFVDGLNTSYSHFLFFTN
ncbi:hypothetical protein SAMN05216474_0477 [Lishizhenia tianjinensis]|uniref:Uncharacterized protein n=1 Tax=Lishizhenia tianjinensis TaxID=477690 RepID=A0A1I6XWD3_9FLAO|nr:hypothetical protein [Lishizhenia tianjinensis]SFT42262.1 hypothetical protein SAMN05216474_0477 [Lishizhenia tianjinensis]